MVPNPKDKELLLNIGVKIRYSGRGSISGHVSTCPGVHNPLE
jgi:hypothetical protein